MGGVQIKNCTNAPLKVQLWQVSCLYHDLVKPGEYFRRDTGAVHFTIVVTVSQTDDTSWTDTVLPIAGVVGSTLFALATGGGSLMVTAGAASARAGGAILTKEVAKRVLNHAKPEHSYLSSAGWYFGGENYLEIRGGPRIRHDHDGFHYDGSALRIVDKNDSSRHS